MAKYTLTELGKEELIKHKFDLWQLVHNSQSRIEEIEEILENFELVELNKDD